MILVAEMKQAYLIIAHNEFGILQKLVSALDGAGTDIYIHFDAKVKGLPEISTTKSRLFILDNRVNVQWGTVSQIKCELTLFEAVATNRPYDFYHVISGTHLPLKSTEEINAYFEDHKGETIVTGLCQDIPYQETLKMRRYNLFLGHSFWWRAAIAIQRILHIERNRGRNFYKASNWSSLSQEAMDYILSRKKEILKIYKYSFCGDEYFVPSELMDSPLKDTVRNDEKYLLHNITRANAATFKLADLSELKKTDYLFARKFTSK